VAAGALVGPAQVLGRVLEFGLLRRHHPLLSARLAAAAPPLGAGALLAFGLPAAAPFALLHGLGNGILTIAKGTLPLALFGAQGYGARQGWLSLPAQALQALLQLLRDSGVRQQVVAPGGQFQQSLAPGKIYQLLRLRLDPALQLVPEISGHRLMVSVRLMRAEADGRLRPSHEDVSFELALCA